MNSNNIPNLNKNHVDQNMLNRFLEDLNEYYDLENISDINAMENENDEIDRSLMEIVEQDSFNDYITPKNPVPEIIINTLPIIKLDVKLAQ